MATTYPATIHPLDVEELRRRVQEALSQFVDRQRLRFDHMGLDQDSHDRWTGAVSTVREFLDGGKRLRAAFCYWGWRGAGGGSTAPGIVDAAACWELLHAFALIHDDLIDDSDSRRGGPSLHRRHADEHRRSGQRGRSDRFGSSVALLLGDLCLSWFHEMLTEADLPAERKLRAHELVGQILNELVVGQYLDLAEEASGAQSLDRASTVMRFKTAKYTVERPLHMGAVLAGAGHELLDDYSAYAMPLGEAFQLRDDVLGAFGDPAVTGKPVADDLRARKSTALVAMSRVRATAAQATEIDRWFAGGDDLDDDAVGRVRTIIVDTGALAESERLIQRNGAAASEALEAMSVESDVRAVLGDLVSAATTRVR
ncbi:polyprenyl synthetase family protein [Parasphingorhabdus pacifica]